jgi:hypothetical protein
MALLKNMGLYPILMGMSFSSFSMGFENIDSNRKGFRETFFGAQALYYMCTAASAGGAALPARHLVSALQL